jgi:N-acetylglucosamine-6-phosphate deacetylase
VTPVGNTPLDDVPLEGRLASGEAVLIRLSAGRIDSIEPAPDGGHGGRRILPGLVDLQVNGYGGLDVNAPDLTTDTVHGLAVAQARAGVTAFCPTIITAPKERIVAALRVIARARAEDPFTRDAIPCVHVEGPHLCADDGPRGAHDATCLRPPDLDEFHRWQAACDGLVGIVTLAPELERAAAYIAGLARTGVIPAIGHTAATPAQIRAAVGAGARLSTHLGNGTYEMLRRHPNHLWTQLAADELSAGFIADGHHLPADTFTAMVRAKGVARSVLVSDSAALAGCPPGEYTTPVGGRVTITADGRLTLAGGDLLAGSARSLDQCLAWAVGHAGLKLPDAAAMASANPNRLLGRLAAIAPGHRADLVVLDDHLRVELTVVAGRVFRPAY